MVIKNRKEMKVGLWIGNGIMFVLSAALSINMFIQFSDIDWIKALFVLMSTIFEAGRVAAFVGAVLLIMIAVTNKKWKLILPAFFCVILYGVLASIIVLASIGFSAGNFNKQAVKYENYTESVKNEKSDKAQIDEQIKLELQNKEKLLSSTNTRQWQINEVNQRIDSLRKEKKSFKKEIAINKNVQEMVSATIFDNIHSIIGIPSNLIKGYLLLAFAAILELLLQITNAILFVLIYYEHKEKKETEEKHNKETKVETSQETNHSKDARLIIRDNKDKMLMYIDALMDIPVGLKRLNSNDIIINKTKGKLTENECVLFKRLLNSGIKRGENYLITTVMGSSNANFSKEVIRRSIEDISEGKV